MPQHNRPDERNRERARALRQAHSIPQAVLWSILRGRRLGGLKFRRQVPFAPYFADFYCHEAKLVVELDGWSHAAIAEDDEKRQRYLESLGLRVVRVTNSQLADSPEAVAAWILRWARGNDAAALTPALSRREREPE